MVLLGIAAAAMLAGSSSSAAVAQKPNILMILIVRQAWKLLTRLERPNRDDTHDFCPVVHLSTYCCLNYGLADPVCRMTLDTPSLGTIVLLAMPPGKRPFIATTIVVGMGGPKSGKLYNHAFRSSKTPRGGWLCRNLAPQPRDHRR